MSAQRTPRRRTNPDDVTSVTNDSARRLDNDRRWTACATTYANDARKMAAGALRKKLPTARIASTNALRPTVRHDIRSVKLMVDFLTSFLQVLRIEAAR